MSDSVLMPALGESVTEGTVTRWLKQVGDDGRRRRAAARGLHRQGRHRDPVARSPGRSSRSSSARTRPSRSAPRWPRSARPTTPGRAAGREPQPSGGAQAAASRRPPQAADAEPSRTPSSRRRRGEEQQAAPVPRARRAPTTPAPRSAAPQPQPCAAAAPTEDVTMPALGESVTEGTVTRWLKQVGDERRGRRAAARGLHRQGRHRDPVARSPGR